MAHKYTEEHIQFLREHVKGRTLEELRTMFNAKFNAHISQSSLSNAKTRYGLKSGIKGGQFEKGFKPWNKGLKGLDTGGKETRFKKGNKPLNSRPVGFERIDVDDYVVVKVAEPSVWKMKHVMAWEKENGPVPKGYTVIFGDGNRQNFDIDNLILVSRKQLLQLNRHHLISNHAELTRTGVMIADIYSKISERKNR
ncbi:HNH endonuclease signature motif containing protein [Sutcliffiella horikoshii]|uniref:HNH endonuclease signature motif containing protein n=1 Tax=Sutcliffiella horikoshii TaxID=79883 RepID=UPI003CF991BA